MNRRPQLSRRPSGAVVRLTGLTAAAVLGLSALAGCSGGSDSSDSSTRDDSAGSYDSSSDQSAREDAAPPAGAPSPAPEAPSDGSAESGGAADGAAGGVSEAAVREASIISVGTVTLESDDVAEARRGVQRLGDEVGGEVAQEETTTDRDGVVDGSRIELRVPSEQFDATMTGLEDVADVVGSTRGSDDVSTEVVDTQARLRAQEESLQRIELLLAEADDLAEIVSIEAELTRRQADLDGLASQLAYLADATTWSTVTVYLERADADEAADDTTDEAGSGFLDGVSSGWDGLVSVLGGLALVAGVLLPWVGLALVIGVPLLWATRRLVRRARARAGERPPAAGLPAQGVPTA